MSRRILAALMVFTWFPSLAFSQETTGKIGGTVTDPSGAVLPGVTVSVRNEQTGLSRSAVSDEQGSYLVPLLPVGTYSVRAELPGFKTFLRTEIKLDVNENERIDVELEIGGIEETVTVAGDVIHVETTSSALSRMVDRKQILDLPLNGRNFLQLGLLLPGVAPLTPVQGGAQGGKAANQGFSVNGMRSRDNRFLIDGAINMGLYGNGSSLRPPPDALEQFNIITNSFSAEFGQSAGAIVNIITRSGTNQLHGGVFEFHRNDALDARNFFAPGVPPLKQHQFGVTLGGPVRLPGIYNGHDKTHFFFYYEGFRNRQGITRGTTVPTVEQRRGDLSAIRTPIIDPLTGTPFPGNIIPQERIHPIARTYLDLYPQSNGPGGSFTSSPTQREDREQFGGRIDHSFSLKNHFYGRYLISDSENITPFRTPGTTLIPGYPVRQTEREQSFLLANTHVFSPRLLSELRFNFHRSNLVDQIFSNRTSPASLGFEYPVIASAGEGPPILNISGFSSIGNYAEGPTRPMSNAFQLQENISYTRGKHALKFGFDFRHNDFVSIWVLAASGSFSFTGDKSGHALADFLLGLPSSFNQGRSTDDYWNSQSYDWYVQDDFKVHPRLTLNLGVRWELNTPWVEERDRLATIRPGQQSRRFPQAPTGLVFPGDPGIPRATVETDMNNWAPRFGFAWDIFGTGRTSLRGGYGLSYDWINGNAQLSLLLNQPFAQRPLIPSPPSFSNPYLGQENPLLKPVGEFSFPIGSSYMNPANRTPYGQLWNLTIQRDVGQDFLLEAGYVASKGTKLTWEYDVNPPVYIPGQSSVRNTDQRRIRFGPAFSSVSFISTAGSSNYHSLQTNLNKRFTRAYGFRASYTWSKAIDFAPFKAGEPGGGERPQQP